MDYIIFGIGASASLVLIGWLLRDWGPRLRDRKPPEDEILSANELVIRMAWARFCATCGMALVFCGVLVMLVTIAAMFIAPSDNAALLAVLAAFGLSVVLMLIWDGLFLRQFGSIGVHRPVEKTSLAAVPEEAVPETAPVAADQGEADAPTPVPAPAPTFAETAASRGGLGRFAAFFRRDAEPVAAADAPGVAASTVAPTSAETGGEPTPTDAVIAELAGESHEADSKKLSETDPLVTSVRAEVAALTGAGTDAEPDLVAETLNPDAGGPDQSGQGTPAATVDDDSDAVLVVDESAAPGSDDDGPAETSSESPPGDRPAHELALENLRMRRLARLAHKPDPE